MPQYRFGNEVGPALQRLVVVRTQCRVCFSFLFLRWLDEAWIQNRFCFLSHWYQRFAFGTSGEWWQLYFGVWLVFRPRRPPNPLCTYLMIFPLRPSFVARHRVRLSLHFGAPHRGNQRQGQRDWEKGWIEHQKGARRRLIPPTYWAAKQGRLVGWRQEVDERFGC